MVILLKLVVPLPDTVCVADPVNVTLLVEPVKVPLLLMLPPKECANEAAPSVQPLPMVTSPLTVNADAAVAVQVPDIVRLPKIASAVPGKVFVPLPLSVRWPYAWLVTVWFVPEYSTVLVAPSVTVA